MKHMATEKLRSSQLTINPGLDLQKQIGHFQGYFLDLQDCTVNQWQNGVMDQ